MKKLLFILLFIPSLLFAQEDAKYLTGAVPEVDGKVVFSKEFYAPSLTQKQIYDNVLAWAKKRFVTGEDMAGKVAYSDENNGNITCFGNESLVLKKTAISLDRAQIIYGVTINFSDGKCDVKIHNISYSYNVSYKSTPETYIAEDWITDKETIKKGKLIAGTKKFRIKTIDFVDDLFKDIQSAIGSNIVSSNEYKKEIINNLPTKEVVIETAPEATDLSGYKKISPDKIPGNIIKMLRDDWMLITAGNNDKYSMMTASWGGLGHLYGKPVAMCFISPSRNTYKLMEDSDTYTLTFYTEAYREVLQMCGNKSGKDVDKVKESGLTPVVTPNGSHSFGEAWLVIECRKMVSQPIDINGINDENLKKQWEGKATHKMYIGEILNVWVK